MYIIFSDLHIDHYTKFNKGYSRLDNCIKALSQVFEQADEYGIDYILFAGDLFNQETALKKIVVNKTVWAFAELFSIFPKIKFIAISGNHDMASDNTLENEAVTALEHLAVVFPNFILIDNTSIPLPHGGKVYGIPYYTHAEHFKQKLKLETTDKDIILIHQTPRNKNPMIPFDFEAKDLPACLHTFCGHIHTREYNSDRLTTVGSPLHKDLGDEGQDKGFLIYDPETNESQFIPLDFPKFKRTNDESESDYCVPIVAMEKPATDEHSISLNDTVTEILEKYVLDVAKKENIYLTKGLELC